MREFVRNWLHFSIPDENMKIIPYPYEELQIHVTQKFLQIGAITGLLISPFVSIFTARRTFQKWSLSYLRVSTRRTTNRTSALFLSISFPAQYYAMQSQTEEQIVDRCYNLRYNRQQLRWDQSALTGGILGLIIGVRFRGVKIGCRWFLPGYALGTLTAVTVDYVLNPDPHVWMDAGLPEILEEMQSKVKGNPSDLNGSIESLSQSIKDKTSDK